MQSIKNFNVGDVVEYKRYNITNGWQVVKRAILKITRYSIILDDDVISNANIARLKKC